MPTTTALVLWQPRSVALAELRTALAHGQRVWVWLHGEHADDDVEGAVEHVSTTGAFAVVAGLHVPVDTINAVTSLGATAGKPSTRTPRTQPQLGEDLS
jgi:hypothetical protein